MRRRRAIKYSLFAGVGITPLLSGCNMAATGEPREIDDVTVSTDSDVLTGTSAIVTETIAPQSQGVVQLGVKYTGDETRGYSFGNTIPVGTPITSVDPEGLILTTRDSGLVRKNDSTWIANEVPSIYTPELTSKQFQPMEEASEEYLLWGHPDYFDAIEPGDYRFESNVYKRGEDAIAYTIDISIS